MSNLSADEAFVLRLLESVRAGNVSDVMVIATQRDHGSIVSGPGLDKQLNMLGRSMQLTAQARQVMEQGPLSFTPAPTGLKH